MRSIKASTFQCIVLESERRVTLHIEDYNHKYITEEQHQDKKVFEKY